MERVHKYGQMGLSMKDCGLRIKLMAEVNSGMQMEMFTRESGKMIRQMAMEFTFM